MLIGACRVHSKIVHRVGRGLLERDTQDTPAVTEFDSTIANEQMGKVLDSHLPLESHPAAPGRIGAHARQRRHRTTVAACVRGAARIPWAHFTH
ncbi:MAG: hypothetical protein OXG52_08385 [bacterium]|nr:hypothetical protein [bacterium]